LLIASGGDTVEALLRDPSIRDLVEQVIVIESDPRRRVDLERIGDVLVIEGDATDTSIYENLNTAEIDAVLALTSKDEVSSLVLAIASQYKVPIRIGVFREARIAEIARNLRLEIPIVKPTVVAGEIKRVFASLRSPVELGSTIWRVQVVCCHNT